MVFNFFMLYFLFIGLLCFNLVSEWIFILASEQKWWLWGNVFSIFMRSLNVFRLALRPKKERWVNNGVRFGFSFKFFFTLNTLSHKQFLNKCLDQIIKYILLSKNCFLNFREWILRYIFIDNFSNQLFTCLKRIILVFSCSCSCSWDLFNLQNRQFAPSWHVTSFNFIILFIVEKCDFQYNSCPPFEPNFLNFLNFSIFENSETILKKYFHLLFINSAGPSRPNLTLLRLLNIQETAVHHLMIELLINWHWDWHHGHQWHFCHYWHLVHHWHLLNHHRLIDSGRSSKSIELYLSHLLPEDNIRFPLQSLPDHKFPLGHLTLINHNRPIILNIVSFKRGLRWNHIAQPDKAIDFLLSERKCDCNRYHKQKTENVSYFHFVYSQYKYYVFCYFVQNKQLQNCMSDVMQSRKFYYCIYFDIF